MQLQTIWYVLAALFMLGVLITVHELGHFLAARMTGMAVNEFSIGMGPKLFSRKSKKTGTTFSLRAFPLGGFCLFYGEDEEMDDPRAYNRQPVWKRFLSVLAGPTMNFLVAILLFIVMLAAVGQRVLVDQPIVGKLMPDKPAIMAGLKTGDLITAIDGVAMDTREQVSNAIAASGGKPVQLTIQRAGQDMTLDITPTYVAPVNGEEQGRYLLGIEYAYTRQRLPLGQAIGASWQQSVEAVKLMYTSLWGMVTRGEGLDDMTGPVGTVALIQEETAKNGFEMYILLAAIISINLGFVNLLPIPGLDGSRLIFFAVEAIRRKPINRDLEGTIHFVGFVFLIGLMLVFTYKDIARLVTGV